jgi:hypothetical protein
MPGNCQLNISLNIYQVISNGIIWIKILTFALLYFWVGGQNPVITLLKALSL